MARLVGDEGGGKFDSNCLKEKHAVCDKARSRGLEACGTSFG